MLTFQYNVIVIRNNGGFLYKTSKLALFKARVIKAN